MQVRTGYARSGDSDDSVELYYEDMGDPNHPPVLLIMGLGAQLLLWRKGFCEKLVDPGLRVIRYDNRDVGLSTKLTGRHTGAALLPRMVRSFLGRRSPAVYTLEDMAADAYDVKLPRELVLIGKQFLYVERYMKLLAPRWQMMTDPQLTGYFANFMVEVSREYQDPEQDPEKNQVDA